VKKQTARQLTLTPGDIRRLAAVVEDIKAAADSDNRTTQVIRLVGARSRMSEIVDWLILRDL
jgi:hypothetical protein